MGSLKEIKGRINSIESTQKVTSAMKMIASTKLNKSLSYLDAFLPYEQKLKEILDQMMSDDFDGKTDLAKEKDIKRVALVVISSDSGLCGVFNTNIQKLLVNRLEHYNSLGSDNIEIYPIGKKITNFILKNDNPHLVVKSQFYPSDNLEFKNARELAEKLIKDFLEEKIDKVEILYNHYKNIAIQIPTTEQFLPLKLKHKEKEQQFSSIEYIIEPDKKSIVDFLLSKSLHNFLHLKLLDSIVAENAARTMAMQTATDNASDLLEDLNVQYNKQRQQEITNELLDILSGSEAITRG